MMEVKMISRKTATAFTLMEMVVAMSILGVLAGSVFGFLYQTGMTAGEIREADQRDEEVSRFIALLRDTIEQMPRDGRIEIVPPSATSSEFYEIKIVDATTAFSFGERGVGEGDTTIGVRPQPPESVRPDMFLEAGQQFYQIAISREDFGPQDEDGDGMVFNQSTDGNGFLVTDEEGRYWLPILDYITGLTFRFWDAKENDWITEWSSTDTMPPLLEIAITDPYRPLPLRVVFDVPDHLTEPAEGDGDSANQDQTATSTTSSTTRVQPGRGGGDGRRPGGDRGGDARGGKGDGGRPGGGTPPRRPPGGGDGGRPTGPPRGGGAPPATGGGGSR